MKNKFLGRLLKYFIQGLVFISPIVITVYIISSLFLWLDGMVPHLFNIQLYPGAGILIIVSFILVLGFLASSFLSKSILLFLESTIKRIPLINMLYSSSKDVMDAFVGEKKKFDHPVLVKVDVTDNAYRIGFITKEDLSMLSLPQHVAVYFPHSYAISGNVFLIPSSEIIHLNIPSSEAMKFVVSGGVTGLSKKK
jgi:uncharacterized membrane protein